MPRLLLFAETTGYQTRVFAEAARRLGMDLTLATDRCHVMEDPWGDRAIPVRFGDVADVDGSAARAAIRCGRGSGYACNRLNSSPAA